MEIAKPQQVATKLDTTVIANLPYDELIALGLTPDEITLLKGMPPTPISSMMPVVLASSKTKAKAIQAKLDFDPEVDVNGNRLCVVITEAGVRCCNYGTKDIPVCHVHKHKAASIGTYFRSPKLRETYEAFVNSPHKLQCDGELALMRTMLANLLEKVNDDNLNIEVTASVIAISEKITNTIEKISKLEKITPEQLNTLMTKMVEVASKYVPADRLDAFAKDVEGIDLEDRPLRTVSGKNYIPFETEPEPLPAKIEEASEYEIQRKALLDVAQRMGVTVDG